jgi:hypothetical protein
LLRQLAGYGIVGLDKSGEPAKQLGRLLRDFRGLSDEYWNLMKFGIVSLPLFGHLNPMTARAETLVARTRGAVFGVPDIESFVRYWKRSF